ncbi:MAG: outer membrane-specific lipoprotein transporter subunit LolC [Candidatus Hinthialibacteria bacterium OLB16]|nr:MAG: outer membrane-specific lipoprotein transporter subunit LolC [Candidatus Hinthialibacteria bacterium OLB16]
MNWKGPFVNAQLLDKWSRLSGRVVWLEPKTNYTPDEPLADSLVVLKSQRGDKYLMGTRGVPAVLTDDKGAYEFDGAIDITGNSLFNECLVEAYGIADDHFIQANPAAWAELERARSQRGRLPAPLEPDGSVIFAQDMARPLDFPNKVAFIKQDQSLNLVTFPCRALTLYGLTEPRGFIPLKQVVLLEAGTDSPPFQFGQSTSDSTIGLVEENCISLWADPSMNVRITFGLGFQGKRLVLTNSSPEKPFGEGFLFDRISTIPSMVLQGARDMWNLDSLRIEKLEAHGVQNPRIRKLHEESRQYLDKAGQALESLDYLEYRSSSERGWALESKAYSELYTITNNMIRGVLFYLALLVPFAYCFERLLFAAATIRGRILGMMAVFAISFLGLVMVHPAFRFAKTPLVVLLAFLILSLAVAVIALIMGKFDRLLLQQKMMAVGIHEDSANLGGTIARAIDLGISNIRRRPQRCFLTAATIVLITFTLLSFTSLVPETSISILQHPKGEPVYRGLLARDRGWMPIPLPLYQSLKRTFGSEEGAGSEITSSTRSDLAHAALWWRGGPGSSRILLETFPRSISPRPPPARPHPCLKAPHNLAFSPLSPCWAWNPPNPGSAESIPPWWPVPGSAREDQMGIILPLHIAKFLGYGPQDIGKGVLVYGENLPLIGLLDSAKVDKIIDIDGEPIMPVNFSLQTLMRANRTEQVVPDTLEDYVHYSSDQVAIVPLKMALRLGASFRSIGIRVGPGMDVRKEAEGYARRSNQTILASDGETVNLYASLDRSRVNAAAEIIVPVLLAFLMVLGTMLGSVYERRSEIFIYNSVGLSPTHVSMLFLAESAVYAILGASLGYLLGQIVSRLLFVSGLLEGLTLNYSAGSTVFVTGLTMFIVLLSTLFPMRQAFLAAVPETKEANPEGEEESGERLSIFLPFVTDRQSVEAMQAYMLEFLEGVQGVSVGQLAVEDLQVGVLEEEGLSSPVLKFRAWLAPSISGSAMMPC